jgi:phosphatidylserine/phosphatidylglycerophosphate/cardiolipin synthase-like enzyme
MRFRSKKQSGFQISAVTGVNTVSFGIAADGDARKDLLGFGVERIDPQENERSTMYGYKVFRSVVPHPDENTRVSTMDHPVQSFVWDDFTAKPGYRYRYLFHPLKGTPKNLDRRPPIEIEVRTEPLFSKLAHDVFFNRGVASSQAYAHRFRNLPPDDPTLTAQERQERLDWLMRDLDDAILRFIAQAGPKDTLLCCFYEFRYRPVLGALKAAIDRGTDVRVIVDAKENERTDAQGVFHESFPRVENLKTIKAAKLPMENLVLRQARKSAIAHNKFMVFLRGQGRRAKPAAVWTGSTNVSLGGFAGQTNVGHWVRSAEVAEAFRKYWTVLSEDPGAKGDSRAAALKENAAFRRDVEAIGDAPTRLEAVPAGVTPVFSPRKGLDVLDFYFDLVDGASREACITLAFGVSDKFKALLKDHTALNGLVFMLLEKADRPKREPQQPFIVINASNNVYKAWGSFLRDPLYRFARQWAAETNAAKLGLNQHVSYIHSKFLLRDPLGADPVVVTGSANFSDASTQENDENMLVIRGDTRVADIYFTEFNRLFNHYYFRSVQESARRAGTDDGSRLFLDERAKDWLPKYAKGTFRTKRVEMFASMEMLSKP